MSWPHRLFSLLIRRCTALEIIPDVVLSLVYPTLLFPLIDEGRAVPHLYPMCFRVESETCCVLVWITPVAPGVSFSPGPPVLPSAAQQTEVGVPGEGLPRGRRARVRHRVFLPGSGRRRGSVLCGSTWERFAVGWGGGFALSPVSHVLIHAYVDCPAPTLQNTLSISPVPSIHIHHYMWCPVPTSQIILCLCRVLVLPVACRWAQHAAECLDKVCVQPLRLSFDGLTGILRLVTVSRLQLRHLWINTVGHRPFWSPRHCSQT